MEAVDTCGGCLYFCHIAAGDGLCMCLDDVETEDIDYEYPEAYVDDMACANFERLGYDE